MREVETAVVAHCLAFKNHSVPIVLPPPSSPPKARIKQSRAGPIPEHRDWTELCTINPANWINEFHLDAATKDNYQRHFLGYPSWAEGRHGNSGGQRAEESRGCNRELAVSNAKTRLQKSTRLYEYSRYIVCEFELWQSSGPHNKVDFVMNPALSLSLSLSCCLSASLSFVSSLLLWHCRHLHGWRSPAYQQCDARESTHDHER